MDIASGIADGIRQAPYLIHGCILALKLLGKLLSELRELDLQELDRCFSWLGIDLCFISLSVLLGFGLLVDTEDLGEGSTSHEVLDVVILSLLVLIFIIVAVVFYRLGKRGSVCMVKLTNCQTLRLLHVSEWVLRIGFMGVTYGIGFVSVWITVSSLEY